MMLSAQQLMDHGLSTAAAEELLPVLNGILAAETNPWQKLSREVLTPNHPFTLHKFLFALIFPNWREQPETAIAWMPTAEFIQTTNLARVMKPGQSVAEFHKFSTEHVEDFWQQMLTQLQIVFQKPPTAICDLQNIESPDWLVDAKMNIAESCFTADPQATSLIFLDVQNNLKKISYAELDRYTNQIANSLLNTGFKIGDALAIIMPMTVEAIAIYLGIIKMGGMVVSIADSFASEEIATRLQLANAKGVFTQDILVRAGKEFPLYAKIPLLKTIVIPARENLSEKLRTNDLSWAEFLVKNAEFTAVAMPPMTACNILFSSGTTGLPKAIPWNHTTSIKAAADAFLHQNIQAGDVLAWPTNLGWMMGPWLIFAAFINKAMIAVYPDAPQTKSFLEFVQQAKVTMLGVVPTLVTAWRQNHALENLDLKKLKVFTSTGECSNSEDMLYLMSRAYYPPIIEYCGGTEIGGAYISSTVLQNNCPATFSTKVFGNDFVLLDEQGKPSNIGEVALIPPAMGLSFSLLKADHHTVYFANMPKSSDGKILRRHGDQIQNLANGYYCVLGRIDDTMNLGGIKISAVEIERALAGIEHITETAAIGVTPTGKGPTQLIIYAVANATLDNASVLQTMQNCINQHLNPLFKIHQLIFIDALPKTASNKIMRRMLGDLPH